MNLRCKPGDLAVRVSNPRNGSIPVGAVVKVLAVSNKGEWVRNSLGRSYPISSPVWDVEFRGETEAPRGRTWAVPDNELRPLKGGEGQDETLVWAGLPAPVSDPIQPEIKETQDA